MTNELVGSPQPGKYAPHQLLVIGRRLLLELQGSPVVLDRRLDGVHPEGLVPGQGRVLEGPRVCSFEVVMGQQRRQVRMAVGKEPLQGLSHPNVVKPPFLAQDRAVGGFLSQRVPEGIFQLRVSGGLPDELGPLQIAQAAIKLIGRLRDGLQDAIVEGAPDYRSELQGSAGLFRQPIDPRHKQTLQVVRDGNLIDVRPSLPMGAACISQHRPPIDQGTDHFLHEKRISLCLLLDQGMQLRRQIGDGQQMVHQLAAASGRQRLQHDLPIAVRVVLLGHLFDLPGRGTPVGAKCAQEQDRAGIRQMEEMDQQLGGGRVGPVEIVKHEHGRLSG